MKIDRRSGSAPLISVVLPTSNASLHLLPTLASLDQQDQDLFEVIAIDNQSTDGTTSVLAAYVNAGQHHRCMLSAMDMGVADAFNKGISLARGSYLYFICAGDKLRAAVLRKLAPHLDGETDLVYGDIHLLACGRDAHYDNVTPLYMASRSVCHQAMFYHRSIFNRFGGYNPRYKSFSDYELNLRCLFAPRIRAQHIDLIVADYLGNGPSDFGDLSFEADREELITRHLVSDTLESYRLTIE